MKYHEHLSKTQALNYYDIDTTHNNNMSLNSSPFFQHSLNLSTPNSTGITLNSTDESGDFYYYDYEDSVNTLPLAEMVPVAIVYGLTLLLGVIGNALVIFSIARYRRMQTVTNTFLTSLASADLLLVMLCVPIKVRLLSKHRAMRSVPFYPSINH